MKKHLFFWGGKTNVSIICFFFKTVFGRKASKARDVFFSSFIFIFLYICFGVGNALSVAVEMLVLTMVNSDDEDDEDDEDDKDDEDDEDCGDEEDDDDDEEVCHSECDDCNDGAAGETIIILIINVFRYVLKQTNGT